jgi:hypothetical protein
LLQIKACIDRMSDLLYRIDTKKHRTPALGFSKKMQKFLQIIYCKLLSCLLVIIFISATGFAQKKSATTLETIAATKALLKSYLKLEIGNDFYALTDTTGKTLDFSSTGLHYYVYASYKNEMKSVFGDAAFNYFGHNDSAANVFADSLKNSGYDIMVYKTTGTSGAQFNKNMLDYEPGTVAFIMLHEGFHRHRQNTKSKLPYIFEEAVCDLTGNMFCKVCVIPEYGTRNVKQFIAVNEKIYAVINKAIDATLSQKKCSKKIRKFLKKGNVFQHDRYDYEVNNAYLLRYTSYCKYYFALKEAFKRCKEPTDFYDAITKFEGSEEEVLKGIEKIGR